MLFVRRVLPNGCLTVLMMNDLRSFLFSMSIERDRN